MTMLDASVTPLHSNAHPVCAPITKPTMTTMARILPLQHSCRISDHRLFGGGDALHFMGLEAGQDFAGEALDLRHEQIVRQGTAVHRELHGVGAGALGGLDDAFGDLA